MKNLFIFALLFGFNVFSQNFVTQNSEVSTSIQSTEIITPKVTSISKLFYESNDSNLSEDSISSLNAILIILKENDTMSISINSHTDMDENDVNLCAMRALKVKKYLIKNEIKSSRLKVNNFGNSKPIVEGRLDKLDRRVEFIFE